MKRVWDRKWYDPDGQKPWDGPAKPERYVAPERLHPLREQRWPTTDLEGVALVRLLKKVVGWLRT